MKIQPLLSIEKLVATPLRALIFSFLVSFIILAPALLGLRVMHGDATDIIIPQLAFYQHAFQSSQTPFWNPLIAVGFPNFISVGGHPFSPLNILLLVFSPTTAHYLDLWILTALTLFFLVEFLRALKMSALGSLIGGLSYLIAGIWFAQNAINIAAIFAQAVLFWSLIKIFDLYNHGNSRWKILGLIAAGGAGVGYGWLQSGYWPNLYIFFSALAFLGFLVYRTNVSVDRKKLFWKLIFALCAIYTISVAIGAIQLIPTYVLSHYSQRSSGLTYAAAQGYSISLPELLHLVFLTPRRGLDAYLYMGIMPLLLMLFSWKSKQPLARFFRWQFVVVLAIAVKSSPLFWLISKLPLFDLFEGASRFMLLGGFAAAAAVGFGADYVQEVIAGGDRKKLIDLLNTLSAILAVALLAALFVFKDLHPGFSIFCSFALLILGLLIFYFSSPKNFLPLTLLLVLLDFILVFYAFNWPFFMDRKTYEKKPTLVPFLRDFPGRILPLFVEDWDDLYYFTTSKGTKMAPPYGQQPYEPLLLSETFYPNFQLLDNIENLEANEPLLNVEMGRLMALLGTRQLVTDGGEPKLNKLYVKDEKGQDISAAEKFRILRERMQLMNFLGIRYIATPVVLEKLDLKSPFESRRLGVNEIRLLPDKTIKPLFVAWYEDPNYKPLAYFTPVTAFKSDPAEIYQLFKSGNFNDIYVECSDCQPEKFTGAGEATQIKKENGLLDLKTVSDAKQFLVFTQNYLPGWKAFVDDREVPMYKVNTVFPGIFVPAGEHQVEFRYDYWSLFSPHLLFSKHVNGAAYPA